MKEFGYKQSQGDHTLFIKHSAARGVTALLIYVDDIIVTGNDEREKHEVKHQWWIKECTRGWLVGSYTLLTLGQTSHT